MKYLVSLFLLVFNLCLINEYILLKNSFVFVSSNILIKSNKNIVIYNENNYLNSEILSYFDKSIDLFIIHSSKDIDINSFYDTIDANDIKNVLFLGLDHEKKIINFLKEKKIPIMFLTNDSELKIDNKLSLKFLFDDFKFCFGFILEAKKENIGFFPFITNKDQIVSFLIKRNKIKTNYTLLPDKGDKKSNTLSFLNYISSGIFLCITSYDSKLPHLETLERLNLLDKRVSIVLKSYKIDL